MSAEPQDKHIQISEQNRLAQLWLYMKIVFDNEQPAVHLLLAAAVGDSGICSGKQGSDK